MSAHPPASQADEALSAEQLEHWRRIVLSHWATDCTKPPNADGAREYLSLAENERQANLLIEMAKRALFRPDVQEPVAWIEYGIESKPALGQRIVCEYKTGEVWAGRYGGVKHSFLRWIPLPALPIVAALAKRAIPRPATEGADEPTHWLIFFDDHDVKPEIFTSEAAARNRYAQVSISWNAHLFAKVDSNSRDASPSSERSEREVIERCAKVCDKQARRYRHMKGPGCDSEGNDVERSDDWKKECEEMAYCCELNAKDIRALGAAK